MIASRIAARHAASELETQSVPDIGEQLRAGCMEASSRVHRLSYRGQPRVPYEDDGSQYCASARRTRAPLSRENDLSSRRDAGSSPRANVRYSVARPTRVARQPWSWAPRLRSAASPRRVAQDPTLVRHRGTCRQLSRSGAFGVGVPDEVHSNSAKAPRIYNSSPPMELLLWAE